MSSICLRLLSRFRDNGVGCTSVSSYAKEEQVHIEVRVVVAGQESLFPCHQIGTTGALLDRVDGEGDRFLMTTGGFEMIRGDGSKVTAPRSQ